MKTKLHNITLKKVLFPLFVTTVALFAITLILNSTSALADSKKNGSTIAGVLIDNLERKEIAEALQNAIAEWHTTTLVIEGAGVIKQVSKESIQFNIESTIDQYEIMTDKPWYKPFEKSPVVNLPLEINNTETLLKEISEVSVWDADDTLQASIQEIAYLSNNPIEATITDITSFKEERLAFEIQPTNGEMSGVFQVLEKLNGTIIGNEASFSFYKTVLENGSQANQEALNFVASLLYSNALKTNVLVQERHSQKKAPTYLEPGIEAMVSLDGSKDLKLINKTTSPIYIQASLEGPNAKVEFYSDKIEDSVTLRVVSDEEINPKLITRYSKDLAYGKKNVIQEGKKGLRTYIYRTINGEEQPVIRDYYPPVNRIVLESARVLTQNQEVENEVGKAPANSIDQDLSIDLDGDGLPDSSAQSGAENEGQQNHNGDKLIYDKGGNIVSK